MDFTRNRVVQALLRLFVKAESEVALESGLQTEHGSVLAWGDVFVLE